jgi:murein DD-endopeptidase MepM/ murein hydrolase activator NlpD
MSARNHQTIVRGLTGLLAIGVLASPTLVAQAGHAATQDPKNRKVAAPNVFYPVAGTRSVKDRKTYTSRHRGTDIASPCNATVRAATPGVARVGTRSSWKGTSIVRVISNTGGLMTSYAYLNRTSVTNGQVIQSGQALGTVGRNPFNNRCDVYFTVYRGSVAANPSSWLKSYVGHAPPVPNLFGTRGFDLASFNVLGASHTTKSSRYATYPSRLNKAVNLLNARSADVVGLQEFQGSQYDYFLKQGNGTTWGAYFWDPVGNKRDTENGIIWRKSTMEFLGGSTYDIPYFNGNTRHVPVVLLKERATGRTAYFLNVHNPANTHGPAAKWRNQAIAIERRNIIELRGTGRPVFITGDFNDTKPAFCPLTAGKLMISPNSIPSMACAYPKGFSIDWIFGAGQARFSSYNRDKTPQNGRISDHPLVVSRVHLQD